MVFNSCMYTFCIHCGYVCAPCTHVMSTRTDIHVLVMFQSHVGNQHWLFVSRYYKYFNVVSLSQTPL